PLLDVGEQGLHLAQRRRDADHHAVRFPEVAHTGGEEADMFAGQDFVFEPREPFARGFGTVFRKLAVVSDEPADGIAGAGEARLRIGGEGISGAGGLRTRLKLFGTPAASGLVHPETNKSTSVIASQIEGIPGM